MQKIPVKTKEEIKKIIDGGKRLSEIKHFLEEDVKIGVSAWEIEELAISLIKKTGGEAAFARVPKYNWATCINVNEGVVHGIPKKDLIFKKGDVVSVDIGLFFAGFNTDTSFSKGLDVDEPTKSFLNAGRNTLENAIACAVVGARIYDISQTIEKSLARSGFNPVKTLVGHGVGRNLHEEPQIPQFIYQDRLKTPEIPEGAVLAIEIIYSMGDGSIKHEKDGWTIVTGDGKISALNEDTVIVTKSGPLVVTRYNQA
ncbi:MAG: Methionine aminopeptidase [Candidatus Woesebacteria bacterium GW2011_GWC1_38_13]|uniref:Methionine aminopeptidase n=3 Tax=Candidatus Woeseibacteriota TaxID=1752722 RepID=A0A0G0KZ83_9BACT|nr:MAG: Methionine aminopeptidase [Candidatus Woesebacteria bacterium GW2011_GWD1_38_10]KKQ56344.1 MAG: Methionine aminopeptidase [Candidatus Woesebacteria bacterium GW2011_GWC1_38_13]KKQ84052.1 MAG: Methionine aminopeptidase [Candidatus Woesebacteria bacterium GW2011_GWA1_38_8]